jgi:SAM-dependent methyltransferase
MPSERESRDGFGGAPRDEWSEYLDAVRGMGPRETCVMAMEAFEREGGAAGKLAVDLGAGDGRDTVELLRRGWRVLAVDASGDAIDRLNRRLGEMGEMVKRLTVRRESFVTVEIPRCELVNASFAIPHCTREEFGPMWARIVAAIAPGGRFAGQLFGVRDEWTRATDGIARVFHSRGQVEELLRPFAIEHLDEVERPGKTSVGYPKYWHVFHIVARKL